MSDLVFFTDNAVPEGVWQLTRKSSTNYRIAITMPQVRLNAGCGNAEAANSLMMTIAAALAAGAEREAGDES